MHDLKKLKEYQIPDYIKRRFWLEKAPKLKKSEIDIIFETLKEFLFLAHKNKELYLSSYIVDEAWHTFILFTKDYTNFCNKIFGEYIHHTPSISKNGYIDDIDKIRESFYIFKNNFGLKIFELDNLFKIKGSNYKGIIHIKENSIYLNKNKIGNLIDY